LTKISKPSPNHASRDGAKVTFLVIHCTETGSTQEALDILTNGDPNQPGGRRSAHFLVGLDGIVFVLVNGNLAAWHAGISFWQGVRNLNNVSIGIEIQNSSGNTTAYPQVQIDAVIALMQEIVQQFKIRAMHIVAHSDIAPDRKQDPGAMFPWQEVAAAGLGVWPAPTQADRDSCKSWTDADVRKKLIALGYPTQPPTAQLVAAFQRRWQPEVVIKGAAGTIDDETKARLAYLLRKKASFDKISAARKQSVQRQRSSPRRPGGQTRQRSSQPKGSIARR
jgi:N-acetylmuramoyl-L-alanine amidase